MYFQTALGACVIGLCTSAANADWKPAAGVLATRWAKEVSPQNVLKEYPRPQMVRDRWQSLNGLWKYAVRPKAEGQPTSWDGEILVPFCIESALSGVKKTVGPDRRLWYQTKFRTPTNWADQRVLLHFGAVDWDATVWLNGRELGKHRGGYDAFSFDVTDALVKEGDQQLVVAVWDPTDAGYQPRGKQVRKPEGIYYTAVTGIWQSVWIEPAPQTSIRSLKIVPDVDQSQVRVQAAVVGAEAAQLKIEAFDGDLPVGTSSGDSKDGVTLKIENPKLWSPDSPHLYDLKVTLLTDGKEADQVKSYFGMRAIAVRKDQAGFQRFFLNGKPLFHFGPLDQGWWPDGLYTAPADEALRYDVEITRRLGFNMARKHVKVEPARWYYWCDKLGLMVWQDMPSGDKGISPLQADLTRTPESAANFRQELKAMMDGVGNHPSIVAWVPFNEGWGQFETNVILDWTKHYDPTRLVDGPSGWSDRKGGDMHDMHMYPGPGMFALEEKRASVLGEFGGLGLPIIEHLWNPKMRNWGYRTYKSKDELQQQYEIVVGGLRPLIGKGLAAAVYTQTTDVEGEVNGLLTYDRAVVKLDEERVAMLHRAMYLPPPIVKSLSPDSRAAGQKWRYTTSEPAGDWNKSSFDDSSWKVGEGGFGTRNTPGTIVRTEWSTPVIWLRRAFDLKEIPKLLELSIHHDEDCVVYLNGVKSADLKGYTTDYVAVRVSPAALAALRPGVNVLAVQCRQTAGGQYIDVGLDDLIEQPQP